MVLDVMYLECRGRIFACGINRQYYVEWVFVGLYRWVLLIFQYVASLRDAALRHLSITALRLRLVPNN